MSQSICIVASTLPAGMLARHCAALSVVRIVTMSSSLKRSYQYLSRGSDGPIVSQLPRGAVPHTVYLLCLLIYIRITHRRLVIFHECCMPILDLLILLIKPQGAYYPQVTMEGSVQIEFERMPSSKLVKFLAFFRLSDLFTFYYAPPVGGNPPEYYVGLKHYPASIIAHNVGDSNKILNSDARKCSVDSRCLLLLLGKSMVSDAEQLRIFAEVVELAEMLGYECHIKDHPNRNFRLGFVHPKALVIEPEIPLEFLTPDAYAWVIGVSSSGLLNFGDRLVSLIDLFEGVTAEGRGLMKQHFDSVCPSNKIIYAPNLEELAGLLTKK